MTNNQPEPFNNDKYDLTEREITCAGKGCNNLATSSLKIALIKRTGDFCNTCKKELEQENLVLSSSTINLGVGKGVYHGSNKWIENERSSGTIGEK